MARDPVRRRYYVHEIVVCATIPRRVHTADGRLKAATRNKPPELLSPRAFRSTGLVRPQSTDSRNLYLIMVLDVAAVSHRRDDILPQSGRQIAGEHAKSARCARSSARAEPASVFVMIRLFAAQRSRTYVAKNRKPRRAVLFSARLSSVRAGPIDAIFPQEDK